MTDRYKIIVGILDDPLNLVCFVREFQRRKPGKFLLPPLQRQDGGWALVSTKEALKAYEGYVLPREFNGEVYYNVLFDGNHWFVINPRTDEEIGPFDQESSAISEAQSLAASEGLTLIGNWPWDFEDVMDHKV